MSELVGPVILRGELGEAVVETLQMCNPRAVIGEAGAYVRVAVPGACHLPVAALEERLGRELDLPRELEAVMPAFAGSIVFCQDQVVWLAQKATAEKVPKAVAR